jgi:cyclophilin family peptidyl-prolyl cis-trans isomerase
MLVMLLACLAILAVIGQEIVPRDQQHVECQTTLGPFTMRLRDDWAPRGAARVRLLVETDFYTNIAFFRVNEWITQFGARLQTHNAIDGKPWKDIFQKNIQDDPNPFVGESSLQ